ncbi:probable transporter Mch2p [[Candida] anglica]|uniref:Probable transporter Mch2p n=1 Tax=[Candida] anglica TaxID=148631 RepID=A0ABP0EIS2_9ASCO
MSLEEVKSRVTVVSEEKGTPPECPDVELIDKDVDGGYAWVVVFSAFLLTFSTWGLNSAYGIYFAYYVNSNHFPGARVIDYAAVGGISFGVGLSFSPVVNFIQGKIGTKATILLGNCMQFASLIMASFAVNLWQLYLTQGLLQSFGMCFISLPAMTIVTPWFRRKRVLANAISVTGSGVGGLVFVLSIQKVIETRGVHWALRAQAIISAVLVLLAAVLIRTKNKQHHIEFTVVDKAVAQCVGFWIYCFYLVTSMLGYVVVMYSLADFTISLGYTSNQGAIVSAMLQVGFCIGRPLAGFLADRLGSITVTTISYFMAAIFTFGIWVPAKNFATAVALGLLEGIFMGTVFPTSASNIIRIVGMRKLNVAFCMSWFFFAVSALFSQLIGSSLTSGSSGGEYRNTAIFAGACFLGAGLSTLILRGYIAARDRQSVSAEAQDNNEMDNFVPPLEAFKYCFKWTKRRV